MATRNNILAREIEKLKQHILLIGGLVETALRRAAEAVRERDVEKAKEVIEADREIDHHEVELEEECLKVLALHQPVAVDLRFIVAVIKINNDLERVGDLASAVADHAIFLAERPQIEFPFDFEDMINRVRDMLRTALDALVKDSSSMAQTVRLADDEVDEIHHNTYIAAVDLIRKRPDDLESIINTIGLSRRLERVADQATNIAETVIYLEEGHIVRHMVPRKPTNGLNTAKPGPR